MASKETHPYLRDGFWHNPKNQFWKGENSLYSEKSKKYLDNFVKGTRKHEPVKG